VRRAAKVGYPPFSSTCAWCSNRINSLCHHCQERPLLPLSTRLFAAVQFPDCGHLSGVRHLDDGLAAVRTSQTYASAVHRVFNLVNRAKKPVCFQGNGKPQE
jgi:hypothetical protein